MLNSVSLRRNR